MDRLKSLSKRLRHTQHLLRIVDPAPLDRRVDRASLAQRLADKRQA